MPGSPRTYTRKEINDETPDLCCCCHDIDCGSRDQDLAGGTFRSMKARVIENFERSYIEQLLGANGGNVSQAARAAGKNRRAFFELMRKYRIASESFRIPPQ